MRKLAIVLIVLHIALTAVSMYLCVGTYYVLKGRGFEAYLSVFSISVESRYVVLDLRYVESIGTYAWFGTVMLILSTLIAVHTLRVEVSKAFEELSLAYAIQYLSLSLIFAALRSFVHDAVPRIPRVIVAETSIGSIHIGEANLIPSWLALQLTYRPWITMLTCFASLMLCIICVYMMFSATQQLSKYRDTRNRGEYRA